MTADPPGRAPNPTHWAIPTAHGWWLTLTGTHHDGTYTETVTGAWPTADAALAWLTDHRTRSPR